MNLKRIIETELEPTLFSLGYKRGNWGQGWYQYKNDEAGIGIEYHVARVGQQFTRGIEVDFVAYGLGGSGSACRTSRESLPYIMIHKQSWIAS